MTTNEHTPLTAEEVMRLAIDRALHATFGELSMVRANRHASVVALRTAVEQLVAERDALRTERDTLRQVIEQQLLTAEPGYVLVPVEPTQEMLNRLWLELGDHPCKQHALDAWKSAIAAAPSAKESQT